MGLHLDFKKVNLKQDKKCIVDSFDPFFIFFLNVSS